MKYSNDPIEAIVMMFQQGLQNQDCSMLAAGAEAFLLLVNQASPYKDNFVKFECNYNTPIFIKNKNKITHKN